MSVVRANFLSEGHKEKIRNRIIQGARNYKKYLCNKIFRVFCDDGSEEYVRFCKEDFQHLTGIKSNLNSNDFFDNCVLGIIDKGNILSKQKYDWSTLNKKSKRIENIHHLLYKDGEKTLLLEKLDTNTYIFPVAIKNIGIDTCIGFVTEKNKAKSLRNAKNSNNAKSEKRIIAIFAMSEEKDVFDELVYLANIQEMSMNIDRLTNNLAESLSQKLSHIIKNSYDICYTRNGNNRC